jgi:type II secretory pathway component GspD/PulD (secretin)
MPVFNSTTASTTINAMDGHTVVFAGLITEEKTSNNRSIPGLNRIPLVRHLFEYDSRENRRSELLIVLTPRIIRTQEDLMNLNQQQRERMQWCATDVVRLTGNPNMRRRSDEWFHNEVRHTPAAPVILNDSQLPADNRIPTPMLPTMIETR